MTHQDNMTSGLHEHRSERYIWILFNTIVLLSSLIGDTVILYGTIRHNAITLHRVVVVLIQHLAVCDIFLAVFRVFPTIVSLITDRWVFGTSLCYLNDHVHWLCNPLVMALTCALSIAKFLSVKFPFRADTWTRKQAHIACFVLWGVCLISPSQLIRAVYSKQNSMHFCYIDYSCSYNMSINNTNAPTWLYYSTSTFLLISPILISFLLLSTCTLLLAQAWKTARRYRQHLRWQGILTVTLTTAVFFVSLGPYFIVKTTNDTVEYHISTQRAVEFLQNINIMANFFVYSLTVRSFRRFLMSMCGVGRVSISVTRTADNQYSHVYLSQRQRSLQPMNVSPRKRERSLQPMNVSRGGRHPSHMAVLSVIRAGQSRLRTQDVLNQSSV
ncbi:neuropeptide FF receptor 2-like [Bolinopsis microptera]|uniref:neuropeptide FF receptor 2-like n=1 Tax=Bolinopsis microptera TaxID=2820187 RepID=UPI0030790930